MWRGGKEDGLTWERKKEKEGYETLSEFCASEAPVKKKKSADRDSGGGSSGARSAKMGLGTA